MTLVHGRITENLPIGVNSVEAFTNEAMGLVINSIYPEMDMVFMAAAVSDFKVKKYETEKIKKQKTEVTLYGKNGEVNSFGELSKEETAHKILDEVMKSLNS